MANIEVKPQQPPLKIGSEVQLEGKKANIIGITTTDSGHTQYLISFQQSMGLLTLVWKHQVLPNGKKSQ